MAKHTPGPWAYESTSGAIFYADGDVEPVIAGINQDGTSEEQADADGRLMAAAPDMLAALKAIVAALDGRVHSSPALKALADASEAIAKAEGRA